MVQSQHSESDLFPGGAVLQAVSESMQRLQAREAAAQAGSHSSEKKEDAFKSISETAELLALPQHVLRFWESKFPQIKPVKLKGGRRYYRPHDIEALFTIKHLLYKEGYTIKGARRALAQVKKHKEKPMPDALPPKKSKRTAEPETMDDIPLFSALLPPKPAAEEKEPASVAEAKTEMEPKAAPAVVPISVTAPVKEAEAIKVAPAYQPLPASIHIPALVKHSVAAAVQQHAALNAQGHAIFANPTVVAKEVMKPLVETSRPEIAVVEKPVETVAEKPVEPNDTQRAQSRKNEMRQLHNELLELRSLLHALPSLTLA